MHVMQLLCSPRCSFEPQNRGPARTPALRAFAPDSMVGLAFTRSTPPRLTLTTRATPHAPTSCSTPAGMNWTSSARTPRQSASQRSARVHTTRSPSATKWVDRGNAVLDKPGAAAHMLETQDVYTLVQRFHEHESDQPPFTENDPNQAWPCQAWPLTVSTLNWFARSLASTVMDYAAGWRLATGPEARLLCHEYAGLPRPRRALDLGGHRAAMGLPASAIASSGNAPACRRMHA